MYFLLKNCSLTICKSWRVRVWPVTWGLTLGFDRLKTTPDRSALGAGCTTTLIVSVSVLSLFESCESGLLIYREEKLQLYQLKSYYP